MEREVGRERMEHTMKEVIKWRDRKERMGHTKKEVI